MLRVIGNLLGAILFCAFSALEKIDLLLGLTEWPEKWAISQAWARPVMDFLKLDLTQWAFLVLGAGFLVMAVVNAVRWWRQPPEATPDLPPIPAPTIHPGRICPTCGHAAMRVTDSRIPLVEEDRRTGKVYRVWACQACGASEQVFELP